jgi:hypothetical protein
MLLENIILENITVKPPKRIDSFMASKLHYNDGKFTLTLKSCRIVSCKTHNERMFLKLKIPSHQEKELLKIEEYIVDTIMQNADNWFKSKFNSKTIAEYFISSLTPQRNLKCVLKLNIESPTITPADTLVGHDVDITLQIKTVRFLKTSFWLCYDVLDYKQSESQEVFRDDDTSSLCDEEIGPDFEEKESLMKRYRNQLEIEIRNSQSRLEYLQSLLDELNNDNYTIATLDAVENAIA